MLTQQDSARAFLETFQRNIVALQQGLDAAKPVIANLKKVLALQWFLGNIFIVLVFIIGLMAIRFNLKALKAFNPEYKLPKRWIYGLIAVTVFAIVAFNYLPLGININAEIPSP